VKRDLSEEGRGISPSCAAKFPERKIAPECWIISRTGKGKTGMKALREKKSEDAFGKSPVMFEVYSGLE